MTGRQRRFRSAFAVALVIVGVACGAVIPGTPGGTLATAFIGLGLIGLVSLIFYEVGLTEDRERARAQRTSERPPSTPTGGAPPGRRRPRRPDRMRGQRRRLR